FWRWEMSWFQFASSDAKSWFATEKIDDRIWCLSEPHVHPIFNANIFLVLGSDRDLVVDSGMGVAPLKPAIDALRPEPDKPVTLLTTHTHIDHIGAAHEFDHRLVHPIEAEELAAPEPFSLRSGEMPKAFESLFKEAGYDVLWPVLIDALPYDGYDIDAYGPKPAPASATVEDGDVIDLGDWQAEVIHLPGHSPGQVGLWHAPTATLFGADAIYDGPLIYQGEDMSVPDYAATLRRIAALPATRILGGHDPAFGRERLDEITAEYLTLWGA
ncbi:MAG: MBL fold metallo-hydrolase, partial [Pseudomonadota bacterium]